MHFSFLIRFKRQRKDQHSVHKKYTLDNERGNTSSLCDREEGIEKTDEIEIETFSIEAEQLQDTAEEDDYYFHDPTTIGKLMKIHSDIQNVFAMNFPCPVQHAVPGFDPISIERFPEYVRDLIQNKEDRMKPEFMVGLYVCVCLHIHSCV